jgi:hypothetical protein
MNTKYDFMIGNLVGGLLVLLGAVVGCEARDAKFTEKVTKTVRGANGHIIAEESSLTRYPKMEENVFPN